MIETTPAGAPPVWQEGMSDVDWCHDALIYYIGYGGSATEQSTAALTEAYGENSLPAAAGLYASSHEVTALDDFTATDVCSFMFDRLNNF